MLWKNGVVQNLTDGKKGADVKSIFVSGNDVYAVGNIPSGKKLSKNIDGKEYKYNALYAVLWKNGVAQNLTDGEEQAYATSVYVSGNDVYVAGRDHGVVLWKNGVAQKLTNGEKYVDKSFVSVSGNDVYVVWKEGDVLVLWKNGETQNLIEGMKGTVNSVFVFGNDVYVAGREENEQKIKVAMMWKNGEPQALTDGTKDATATSIFVVE
jgi:sulfur transfer complex TusBCD TusB component (DsrH family)